MKTIKNLNSEPDLSLTGADFLFHPDIHLLIIPFLQVFNVETQFRNEKERD
jgi:hypothetical protein